MKKDHTLLSGHVDDNYHYLLPRILGWIRQASWLVVSDMNECTYFGAPAPEALEAETLYIGFWTDKGHADDTLTAFLQTLKGKRIFLFGTAGFGGSAEYFEQILAAVQKSLDESNTVIGTYMCQGKMPMTVRQQYEKMLQQPNHAPNLEMLIENFDKALAHPDAADLDQLRKKAAEVQA